MITMRKQGWRNDERTDGRAVPCGVTERAAWIEVHYAFGNRSLTVRLFYFRPDFVYLIWFCSRFSCLLKTCCSSRTFTVLSINTVSCLSETTIVLNEDSLTRCCQWTENEQVHEVNGRTGRLTRLAEWVNKKPNGLDGPPIQSGVTDWIGSLQFIVLNSARSLNNVYVCARCARHCDQQTARTFEV